jgi:hypothetical protein
VARSAFSFCRIVVIPSRLHARQVNICSTTGARTGSKISRDLVRPSAALAGLGWGYFCARYPYGGVPTFHPSRVCSRSPAQIASFSCSRNHSATPCFTRRISTVVAFIPATLIGSSVANTGMPWAARSFSSLSAENMSRLERSMFSQITAVNLGSGAWASASNAAMPPSRGMPTSA